MSFQNRMMLPALSKDLDRMSYLELRDLCVTVVRNEVGGFRRKLGWGKPETKPVWWPQEVPWTTKGVQSGVNTAMMRQVVRSCYRHHGQALQEQRASTTARPPAFQSAQLPPSRSPTPSPPQLTAIHSPRSPTPPPVPSPSRSPTPSPPQLTAIDSPRSPAPPPQRSPTPRVSTPRNYAELQPVHFTISPSPTFDLRFEESPYANLSPHQLNFTAAISPIRSPPPTQLEFYSPLPIVPPPPAFSDISPPLPAPAPPPAPPASPPRKRRHKTTPVVSCIARRVTNRQRSKKQCQ